MQVETSKTLSDFLNGLTLVSASAGIGYKVGKGHVYANNITFYNEEGTGTWLGVTIISSDGQIFDAYKFATDPIRSGKQSLLLIDNYVDESVLLMISKRNAGVQAGIYTQAVSRQLQLDVQKHTANIPR